MSVSTLRQRAAQYKLDIANKKAELNLQPNYNYLISTENPTTFYTITRSNYKADHIQLTNFIRNEPYSHITYKDINELLNDFKNAFFTDKTKLKLMEAIPYE